MNRPDQITNIAKSLMHQHGLHDWEFSINTRLTRILGRCNWRKKLIELSSLHVWHDNLRDIKDTILHEIAHALTNQGHNKVFYNKCREIGATPKRCAPKNLPSKLFQPRRKQEFRYYGKCQHCKVTHRRVRLPNGWAKNYCTCCHRIDVVEWVKVQG